MRQRSKYVHLYVENVEPELHIPRQILLNELRQRGTVGIGPETASDLLWVIGRFIVAYEKQNGRAPNRP